MIFTAKQALKKIQSGDLKTIAHWPLSDELMLRYQEQQRPEALKQALVAALVLPGIFVVLAIGNLFVEADMEFLWMMSKFAIASFILIYPLSYLQQWRKNRSVRSAREVYFGENWFLFGKTFVQWKGLVEFRGCALITDRDPKVLVISAKGFGRGQVEQAFMIPIPESELSSAEVLVQTYNQ